MHGAEKLVEILERPNVLAGAVAHVPIRQETLNAKILSRALLQYLVLLMLMQVPHEFVARCLDVALSGAEQACP